MPLRTELNSKVASVPKECFSWGTQETIVNTNGDPDPLGTLLRISYSANNQHLATYTIPKPIPYFRSAEAQLQEDQLKTAVAARGRDWTKQERDEIAEKFPQRPPPGSRIIRP